MEALIIKWLNFLPWFALVFIRISAIMVLLPYFGSRSVPWQFKMGLSGALSMIVVSYLKPEPVEFTPLLFLIAATKEVLIGVVFGFITRLIFDGVQLAGQFIGYQMGFAIVNVFDPHSNTQVSVIAQFKGFLAMLILLSINAHHMILEALFRSFRVIPLASARFTGALFGGLSRLTGEIFVIALKLSAPVMVVVLLTNIVLALINRTMPQINVFFMGFPLEIGLGFLMASFSMPFWFWCYRSFFHRLIEGLALSIRAMGGY